MCPSDIDHASLVLFALFGATPRRIGGHVQVALAYGVTAFVRAAFKVLAFGTHWHGSKPTAAKNSAHRTFHLQLNQAAPLHCVFHWQCACHWFDETVDNHSHCLFLGEATAHEIEQLLVGNL